MVLCHPQYYENIKTYKREGQKVINENTFFCTDGEKEFRVDLLVKNRTGLRNLNKLTSLAYMNGCNLSAGEFYTFDWKEILVHREGLLIGLTCNWEYIRNLLSEADDEEEICMLLKDRYEDADYVQIPPKSFIYDMHESPRMQTSASKDASSEEAAEDTEKSIYGKRIPVTEDECARMTEMAVKAVGYLKEMGKMVIAVLNIPAIGEAVLDKDEDLANELLEEIMDDYDYLGSELEKEIIFMNPYIIGDRITDFDPYPEEEMKIVLPNADAELRNICYENAYKKYGLRLPRQVAERLEEELEKIAKYGYSSYYLLAAKVAKECKRLGESCLARGSAGSSLAAFLAGITETNPLPPHLYCPACGYADFSYWREFGEGSGPDDRIDTGFDLVSVYQCKVKCRRCGHNYVGDGHDIPFESFAGLHGEKQPDFELEVPEGMEGRLYGFLDELFGKDRVFYIGYSRYGTYGTGTRRIIGSNVGRVVIVPPGREIYDYTPVTYLSCSDLENGGREVTLIDYQDLVTRGMLGMTFVIRGGGSSVLSTLHKLERMTGVPAGTVPIDEVAYNTFFEEGLYKDIPLLERMTKYMIRQNSICCFSDIVGLLGYNSENDVWEGNWQKMLKWHLFGTDKPISHMEDVMKFLLRHGIEREEAFRIAEIVRKGSAAKKLTEDDLQCMREHGVSEEYIESMMKIDYLFPKAHSTEYAIRIFKLMWYKVHYPEEYKAAVQTSEY